MKYIRLFENEEEEEIREVKIGDLVKFAVKNSYFGGNLHDNMLNCKWKITRIDAPTKHFDRTVYQLTALTSTGYCRALRHEFQLIPQWELDSEKYNL